MGVRPVRRWSLAAAAALLLLAVGIRILGPDSPSPSGTAVGTSPSTGGPHDYMIISRDDLAALPTSGRAWEAMIDIADGDLGEPDLSDQKSFSAGRTLAAALVHARTGDETYRERAVAQLRRLPRSGLDDAKVLSVGRQLAGWVVVADLVDFEDPAFTAFLREIRTLELGNHSRWVALTQTSEDSGSNWGAWALASRIAASVYLGDRADVERAATVFAGFLGDRRSYSGFRPSAGFDPSWSCSPEAWTPINPPSCGSRSGAVVDDISRSARHAPHVDDRGLTYSWESLGGATLSATLLSRAGYPDVWGWSDDALLRAAEFQHANGGYPPRYDGNQYIPWAVNTAYDVQLGPVSEVAGSGRQFGYTDWLYG